MKISKGLDALSRLPGGAAVTVGNFDGIHIGHQRILTRCRQLRDAGAGSAVIGITFEPHPLTILRPKEAPPRLTPVAIKHRILAEAGIDHLVELPPSPQVLGLEAEAFFHLLRDLVKAVHLVEGRSFAFGKGRHGTIPRLAQWSAGSSLTLHVIEPVEVAMLDLCVAPVSSSLVRWLLGHGRVREAGICLGRPYILAGPVIKGYQRGRLLDVPTANLRITEQLIPADGVYAGRCAIDGRAYPAAISLGSLPTFAERSHQVEAHLIGFNGDLYGRDIEIQLIDWVREQRKFATIDSLKQQMAVDIATATRLGLGESRSAPIATCDQALANDRITTGNPP